jgi:hypothetical protein
VILSDDHRKVLGHPMFGDVFVGAVDGVSIRKSDLLDTIAALAAQRDALVAALETVANYPCDDEVGPRGWLIECMTVARRALAAARPQ